MLFLLEAACLPAFLGFVSENHLGLLQLALQRRLVVQLLVYVLIQCAVVDITAGSLDLFQQEIGKVFCKVLECAGVYKCTPEGQEAFMRFISAL